MSDRRLARTRLLEALIHVLAERGPSRPIDIYDAVADRLQIGPELRSRTAASRTKQYNLFARQCRHAQQRGKQLEWIGGQKHKLWELTDKAHGSLGKVQRGSVFLITIDEDGFTVAGAIEDALAVLDDGSIQLALTSPPYPLWKQKAYGNLRPADHVKWLTDVGHLLRSKLAPDGSLVLNLGQVWQRGTPTLEPYAHRLLLALLDDCGYHLAQDLSWVNPAKPLVPQFWVANTKQRLKPTQEFVFWLSKSPTPKARPDSIRKPHSNWRIHSADQKRQVRPGGIDIGPTSFLAKDPRGAIASSVFTIAHDIPRAYIETCRQIGEPPHPARMPVRLAESLIKLCTDPGDIVCDPFMGSGTTLLAARKLDRYAIGVDNALAYHGHAAMRLSGIN